ncbi:MAG: hypothetical protein ACI9G1_002029 [Pirellulaceae bacterium]|jgi:hypothetical protein
MLRSIPTMFIVILIAGLSGCSMCSTCQDDDYGHFGGKWERTDQQYGRVNSAFAPAATIIGETVVQQSATVERVEEIELPEELDFDSTQDPAPGF